MNSLPEYRKEHIVFVYPFYKVYNIISNCPSREIIEGNTFIPRAYIVLQRGATPLFYQSLYERYNYCVVVWGKIVLMVST